MITKLVLTNFKKHENLTLTFSEGLSALRGSNEAGKSSLFQSIVYAFFGARALPLTLAQTVTYDKPEASLKVELDFVFEGTTYKIVRSKSGAVITNGTVSANGQTEVTKFVEGLFGVNADAATKLMIASQNGLRGALESGEAVPLIEKLANIDLIDGLISKIQDQLPSGNTSTLVASIAEIDKLEEPKLDTSDLEPAVEFTKAALALVEQEFKTLVDSDDVDEGYHRTVVARITADKQVYATLGASVVELAKQIEQPPVPPTADIELLKSKQAQTVEARNTLLAYQSFTSLEQSQSGLTGDYAAITAGLTDEVDNLNRSSSKCRSDIAAAEARLITSTSCGLCGKDLKDVPEVMGKNKLLHIEIEGNTLRLNACIDRLAELKKFAATLASYAAADRAARACYSKWQNYVTLDETVYPAKVSWAVSTDFSSDLEDYTTEIKLAEAAWSKYNQAVAVRAERVSRFEDLQRKYTDMVVDLDALAVSEKALADKQVIQAQIRSKQSECYNAMAAVKVAEHALTRAKDRYAVELEGYNKAQGSKQSLQRVLEDTQKNNALIKKLREVRPVVAARLWAIVLASVSTYFSRIRGESTIITRTSNGFQANGRAVEGLSGSTLDALGLAIRMALGKTFLPSVGFLLLDEPSAGMDDDREAAMLGLLSTVDYEQVIVVTHSTLADSFAANVVTL